MNASVEIIRLLQEIEKIYDLLQRASETVRKHRLTLLDICQALGIMLAIMVCTLW